MNVTLFYTNPVNYDKTMQFITFLGYNLLENTDARIRTIVCARAYNTHGTKVPTIFTCGFIEYNVSVG